MFKKFFENRRKQKELLNELRQNKLNQEVENAKMQVIMDSEVPWMKRITTEAYDVNNPPKTTIRERFMWNNAFISSLKEKGYTGEDEEIVLAWELAEEQRKIQEYTDKIRQERMNSDEPWFEYLGDEYDENSKQVKVKLDWNKAFIKTLRDNGYTGSSDEMIINRYLKTLSEHLADEIASEKFDG